MRALGAHRAAQVHSAHSIGAGAQAGAPGGPEYDFDAVARAPASLGVSPLSGTMGRSARAYEGAAPLDDDDDDDFGS